MVSVAKPQLMCGYRGLPNLVFYGFIFSKTTVNFSQGLPPLGGYSPTSMFW